MQSDFSLNADWSLRAEAHPEVDRWVQSPLPGVQRRLLHRRGGEQAIATSLVRYQPGSVFSAHVHDAGEEFLVLEGVFEDEHGRYPAGSYVRNPPRSRHSPRSDSGCLLFVKLRQFEPEDRLSVRVQIADLAVEVDPLEPSIVWRLLHNDPYEQVRVETWAPGLQVDRPLPDGGEFLVLQGGMTESHSWFLPLAWLRLPAGTRLSAQAGPDGATVWIKHGHLGRRCNGDNRAEDLHAPTSP